MLVTTQCLDSRHRVTHFLYFVAYHQKMVHQSHDHDQYLLSESNSSLQVINLIVLIQMCMQNEQETKTLRETKKLKKRINTCVTLMLEVNQGGTVTVKHSQPIGELTTHGLACCEPIDTLVVCQQTNR